MDLSGILADIAAGSSQATPVTGSAGLDLVTGIPSDIINYVSGLLGQLGS